MSNSLFSDAVPAKLTSTAILSREAASTPVLTEDVLNRIDHGLIAESTHVTDTVLAELNKGDGGEFGRKLTEVTTLAKGVNPSRAGHGIAGWFHNALGSAREHFLASYRTFEQRINSLVSELEKHANLHKSRRKTFDDLFAENRRIYDGLKAALEDGRGILSAEQSSIEALPGPGDGMAAQVLAERRNLLTRLEKRLHDIDIGMTLSIQVAAQIQMMKENSRVLVDKFDTLVNVTIPTWKRQFAIYVLNMEQEKSAKVAKTIDDATNEAIRKNAELLGQNAVNIARSGQRNVVDMETIQAVHAKLIETMEESERVYADAEQRREEEAKQLAQMRQEFVSKVAGPGGPALKR